MGTHRLFVSMWKALRFAVPVSVLAISALAPSVAYPQDADEFATMRQRFNGEWVLAVPESEAQETVDQAVNQAVDAMNFFLRGVARPMLRDNTPLNRTIRIEFSTSGTEQVTSTFVDTSATYTTRPGHPRRLAALDGTPLRVTQRFAEGRFEQVFQADQGTRWNVYTSTGDGRLSLEATTNADMLPQAMRFTLAYRRR